MTQWADEVEAAIETAVGAEVAESVRTRWREHAARENVEVTLFGPFDSGKSSLLKRLLREAGLPTPRWLTISARKETWETNEVDAHGLTFTDTPGVAAGDQDHERIATETITLTDAMLVIVPPQLLTGEKELILPVVTGRFFTPGDSWPFPRGAMTFAITRLDEGGIDPGESEEAFRMFAAAKADELRQLLARAGAEDVPARGVVADPYGLVGNDSGEYQPLGDVDGIAGLISELRGLAERKDELRSAARVRYLLHAGHHVTATVGQHLERTKERSAELGRRVGEQEMVRGELEDLLSAAAASLRTAITDEAQAVAEQSPSPESEIEGVLAPRIEARVAAWQAQWDEQLAELADRLAERYEAAEQRPMTGLIDDLLKPPVPVADRGFETAARAWDLVEDSAGVLERGVRQAVKAHLGMDLEKAQLELKRLEGLSPDAYAKALRSNPKLKDLDRLSDVIGKAAVAAEFAPVVTDVVRGLLAVWREDTADKAKAEELERRRAHLRKAAGAVALEVMTSWRAGVDGLLRAAERSVELLNDTKRGVDDDLERLGVVKDHLDTLLVNAPRPA